MEAYNFIDMTGWIMAEHGVSRSRLKVIERAKDYIAPNGARHVQWLCECMCNEHNHIVADGRDIRSGHTKSCGCYNREKLIAASKKYNNYEKRCDSSGEYYVGWTTNTNKEFYFDVDDYEKVKDYCWFESWNKNRTYYFVASHINGKNVKLHQLVFGSYADHKDRNPMNNRKNNLRMATPQENARNSSAHRDGTSGIVGVCWNKNLSKWRAYLTVDGKQINCGCHIDKEDAIRARLEAEAKYFGEFAPQQNLFEQYGKE